jgi:hypothetical protein
LNTKLDDFADLRDDAVNDLPIDPIGVVAHQRFSG